LEIVNIGELMKNCGIYFCRYSLGFRSSAGLKMTMVACTVGGIARAYHWTYQ